MTQEDLQSLFSEHFGNVLDTASSYLGADEKGNDLHLMLVRSKGNGHTAEAAQHNGSPGSNGSPAAEVPNDAARIIGQNLLFMLHKHHLTVPGQCPDPTNKERCGGFVNPGGWLMDAEPGVPEAMVNHPAPVENSTQNQLDLITEVGKLLRASIYQSQSHH